MRVLAIVYIIIFLFTACTGKMAKIDQDSLRGTPQTVSYKQGAQIPFMVSDKGLSRFKGRPSTLAFSAWAVDVDLKSIQLAAGNKVIASFPPDELPSNSIQVYSYISNFKYKWPSFDFKTRAIVTFDLNLQCLTRDKKEITKTFNINEFKGSYNKVFLSEAHWIGAIFSDNKDERSQMVALATLEAVYGIYKKEIPHLIAQFNK